ncbi:MAG: hypothetical protein P9M14_11135 [Candidatus Alcyoniella australis]|nr:hypothetical protein [Candidatus Alcyoniella australis]
MQTVVWITSVALLALWLAAELYRMRAGSEATVLGAVNGDDPAYAIIGCRVRLRLDAEAGEQPQEIEADALDCETCAGCLMPGDRVRVIRSSRGWHVSARATQRKQR